MVGAGGRQTEALGTTLEGGDGLLNALGFRHRTYAKGAGF